MNEKATETQRIPFGDWWLDVRNISVQLFGADSLLSLCSKDAWRPRWERGLTPLAAIMEHLEE